MRIVLALLLLARGAGAQATATATAPAPTPTPSAVATVTPSDPSFFHFLLFDNGITSIIVENPAGTPVATWPPGTPAPGTTPNQAGEYFHPPTPSPGIGDTLRACFDGGICSDPSNPWAARTPTSSPTATTTARPTVTAIPSPTPTLTPHPSPRAPTLL
ncbi:MAG TPA: hypothetical protein VN812_10460 [Candidatus Acidoferrales bacterium]|nr:hypothetical protein [Candidatus Acidoferrales bacterium]